MIVKRCSTCGGYVPGADWSRHRAAHKAVVYGQPHRQRRAALLPSAYGTSCPLCGEPMRPGEPLDLDHSTPLAVDRTSVGDRIVHARCNRGRRHSTTESGEPFANR